MITFSKISNNLIDYILREGNNMEKNLPVKQNKTFLRKIKSLFAKLFYKKSNSLNSPVYEISKINICKEKNNSSRNEFLESIRVETKSILSNDEIEETLNKIEQNPSLLDNMTLEELEEVNENCKKSIRKIKKKLAEEV